MRAIFLLFCSLLALAVQVQGATPEVGKDRLRMLIKLPTVSFPANWQFDPERGFTIGSSDADVSSQISNLRRDLQGDNTDAERYLDIADLYSSINDNAKAAHNYDEAVALFRNQMQSDDALWLTKFGRALAGAGKSAEAESVLRRAADLGPKNWRCWVALGRYLDNAARHAVYDPHAPAINGAMDTLSASQVAMANKWISDATDAFDKSVRLASNEPEVYLRRGLHRCLRIALLNRIRIASGDHSDEFTPFNGCFSTAALSDLQHASQLSPRDYHLIAATVLFEIYTVSSEKGQLDWALFSWNSLPDKSQRSIRDAITRLDNLGQNPRRKLAAGALESLGILEGPILRQPFTCVTHLRRALALDSSRDQAWETLTATLAQMKHYIELLATCQERVRLKDSARGRVLLAKAYEKVNEWPECEEQIRMALKLDPDDFIANLGLADLMLKHSQDENSLSDANGWLARAEYLLNKMTVRQRTQLHLVDVTLARGIYYALTDEVETARRWIKAVVDQDKENKFAQEILDAIGY